MMKEEKDAIFAFFRNSADAKRAMERLRRDGMSEKEFSLMLPDTKGSQDFAYVLRMKVKRGSLIGGAIGVVLGFFAGLILPFVVNTGHIGASLNPVWTILIVTPLAGLAGMAWGAVIGIGTPESVEERYKLYSQGGGVLLSVHRPQSRESEQRISEVLGQMGGNEIHVMNEEKTWSRISRDWSRLDHGPTP